MSQPDTDWVPFLDVAGDGFERRQRVKRAIRPYLPELMLCIRAMDDPDDVSAASGASYVGFPGGADFAIVDFVGNALVAKGRTVPGDFDLTLTYFPGWFLQVLIRAALIPPWDAPPDRGADFFSFERAGEQIDIAVRHAAGAHPLQITLQQEQYFSKDKTARPFHYHFQPSFWHALTNREDGEPETTLLDREELLRVEWSQPRLTLSLMPGVRSHVREILKSAREICFREFNVHNELMLNDAEANTPGVFATQTVNFDYRRIQDSTLPEGWSRQAPRAGQFTISDCLPPLAETAAFFQDLQRESPAPAIEPDDVDDFDDDDEFDEEELDPFETLDPDLGAVADTRISLEEAALSWPQGDIPFRRFERPGGACFAFFSKYAIMNRLKDERDALEIFLNEDDVMFTMIPRMINWLASPHAWDPLFSPDALLLEVMIDDPSDPNQRFRVDAVPLDADYNAQTPPYDLSILPDEPPWYRVNIQRTEGVTVGVRSHKEFVTELRNGGAGYVEINTRNDLYFDEFKEPYPGRMIDLREGNGYVNGDRVLSTKVTHDDVTRALSNSVPIAVDQMALIAGFTPAGILADLYDGANLIVFGATYTLTGQGYDLFLRKATPTDAASMAVGLLPFLPTGKANKAILNLISLSWGVKDIGLMGYEISRGGSRTHQLALAEAEELFRTIKGDIGTGPGSQ